MSEAVMVAVISGMVSVIGAVFTGLASTRKQETALRVSQAVTDAKIEELTREVRLQNQFTVRMPVVEEQVKVMNHRISDLEAFHRSVN